MQQQFYLRIDSMCREQTSLRETQDGQERLMGFQLLFEIW